MIYHQVRIAMKPDAPEDQVQHALDLMRKLGDIDAVEFFVVGRDFGGEFHYGAMYALKDIDAYRTYMYDPLHRQIDAIGLPLAANMVSWISPTTPTPRSATRSPRCTATGSPTTPKSSIWSRTSTRTRAAASPATTPSPYEPVPPGDGRHRLSHAPSLITSMPRMTSSS
ncbi:Dabb family protein [Nonomuraea sp. NBC_00507]|uniref:Dabb family protein n=1 Tax=Nonomuraea sp. NBC_00507 TaxID=2976002 RepID=UPI002E17552A